MKALSILLLTGILNACAIYSGSEEKIDISTETQIHQLDGLYLNTGEPSGYLSQFIWGSAPINSDIYKEFINHRDIKYIHVISYKSSVLVQAIVNDCVAYEEKYVLGSDFEITN
ncbi:MAG: hypothetical protein EP315_06610, partial [Gammaproteobacteria bacterium]